MVIESTIARMSVTARVVIESDSVNPSLIDLVNDSAPLEIASDNVIESVTGLVFPVCDARTSENVTVSLRTRVYVTVRDTESDKVIEFETGRVNDNAFLDTESASVIESDVDLVNDIGLRTALSDSVIESATLRTNDNVDLDNESDSVIDPTIALVKDCAPRAKESESVIESVIVRETPF